MRAKVVGTKRQQFTGDNGLVIMKKFFVTIDSGETDEGVEVDVISWNEIENGEPPHLRVGQDIEVAYNKRGRLRYVEPKTEQKAAS